jgi:AcrR family transcriptional regulator
MTEGRMTVGDKEARILEAALSLFVERGFHGTAVPLIAERAGVGAGTIYRYFEDKTALGNALFRHWKGRLGEALMLEIAEAGPWRSRFGRLWRALVRFHREHPGAIEFLELQLHADYLDAESQALEQQMAALLFAFIGEAQAEEAVVDLPPAVVIAMVYGAYLGLLRGVGAGWVTLDDATVAATEERAWATIRR